MGFVLEPEQAAELIARNPRYKNCLFPYLNGEDLNSRPDQSPSRWVINFFDWPLNRIAVGQWLTADEKEQKEWLRSGIVPADYPDPVAADYPDLLAIVDEKVKPERDKLGLKNDASAQGYAKNWWQYARKGIELYAAIEGREQVIVKTQVSKQHMFSFVPTGIVFDQRIACTNLYKQCEFSLMQSSIHEEWGRHYGSTLETRYTYTPTNCFETFPFPKFPLPELEAIGERYYQHRQSIMQTRSEGLTKTYNRFHNPAETSPDIAELRRLHVEMDKAVAVAYGWQNLALNHGFHETKQGIRYTISEAARREVLDRLLELNHQRHAEEVDSGLYEKKLKTGQIAGRNSNKSVTHAGITPQTDMFIVPEHE